MIVFHWRWIKFSIQWVKKISKKGKIKHYSILKGRISGWSCRKEILRIGLLRERWRGWGRRIS